MKASRKSIFDSESVLRGYITLKSAFLIFFPQLSVNFIIDSTMAELNFQQGLENKEYCISYKSVIRG